MGGCGRGRSCRTIAEFTGAACTGLDLGTTNIERAKALALEHPELQLKFIEGSFTTLPEELLGKFTVVFSQVAFVHVHNELPAIFQQVQKALAPGGRAVINDYMGGEGLASDEAVRHVYTRLHFDNILGHKAWRRIVDESDLQLKYYQNLDAHIAYGYRSAAKKAETLGIISTDGTPLADNYRGTADAVDAGHIGMNLALLVQKPF